MAWLDPSISYVIPIRNHDIGMGAISSAFAPVKHHWFPSVPLRQDALGYGRVCTTSETLYSTPDTVLDARCKRFRRRVSRARYAAPNQQSKRGDPGASPRSPLACSILNSQFSTLHRQLPGIPGSVMSRTSSSSARSSSVRRSISSTTFRTLFRSFAAFLATSLALS